MTQEQDKAQTAGDEVKTERKRPGPKPKTAQSPVDDVKQSDQDASGTNTEENGNAGAEPQVNESTSSSQTELQVNQEVNSPDQEQDAEKLVSDLTDQSKTLEVKSSDQEQDAEKPVSDLTDESKTLEVKSTPAKNENPFLQAAGDQTPQDGEEKNNEEIVVQKKAIHQRYNPLEVTVRNNGLSTVYEPSTKTSIKAGETVTIECPTNTVKQTVLGNIKQFKALGKNIEVLNG